MQKPYQIWIYIVDKRLLLFSKSLHIEFVYVFHYSIMDVDEEVNEDGKKSANK